MYLQKIQSANVALPDVSMFLFECRKRNREFTLSFMLYSAGVVMTNFLSFFSLKKKESDGDKEYFENPFQNPLDTLWHFAVISPVTQRSIDWQSDYFRHLKNFLQHRSQKGCKVSSLFHKTPHFVARKWAFVSSAVQVTVLTCCFISLGYAFHGDCQSNQPPALLAAALLELGCKTQIVYSLNSRQLFYKYLLFVLLLMYFGNSSMQF